MSSFEEDETEYECCINESCRYRGKKRDLIEHLNAAHENYFVDGRICIRKQDLRVTTVWYMAAFDELFLCKCYENTVDGKVCFTVIPVGPVHLATKYGIEVRINDFDQKESDVTKGGMCETWTRRKIPSVSFNSDTLDAFKYEDNIWFSLEIRTVNNHNYMYLFAILICLFYYDLVYKFFYMIALFFVVMYLIYKFINMFIL